MTRAPADGRLSLSALLSALLVAFTIEFDNEAELHIRHKTTRHGSSPGGVWLVSMAMWLNCMRYVSTEPVTVRQLAQMARCTTNLNGMKRWGYIDIGPDKMVRATARGLRARETWLPLTEQIEDRWRERHGSQQYIHLLTALQAVASKIAGTLPDCMPILGYGLYSNDIVNGAEPGEADVTGFALPWLLAKILLAFAIEFEQESAVSLAIAANFLRVLDERGVPVRELPARSGVSSESIAMATGFTSKRGLTVVEPDPGGSRWKVAKLTAKGARTAKASDTLLSSIEDRWAVRYGDGPVESLRQALRSVAGTAEPGSLLFSAIEPNPDGWRAEVMRPVILPRYPMVLHRGGYPDGS